MSRYDFDDDEAFVVIEKHESAGIASFLVGLAIGAGVALLFAPQSGRATRRGIKRRATRTFDAAREAVENQIDAARNAIDLRKQQVTRAMEAGRAAAHDARLELEARIAESKAAYRGEA